MMMIDGYLSHVVEELFDEGFDLVEENGIEGGCHFVADQLFDMLLDLGTELLVGAQQQPQQMTHKRRHWTVLVV